LASAVPTHWLASVNAAGFPPPATLPRQAHVVIIGGGWMGVSAAYWLARLGFEVLVLEARWLAWGATGRNAGVFLPGSQPLEDAGLIRSVLRAEQIDAEYAEPGHLTLASSGEVWDKIRDEVTYRPTGSPPLHALDRAACEDLLRMRVDRRFAGGRWLPRGGLVHPARLAHGVAAAALRRGAMIVTRTRAVGVRARTGRHRYEVRTTRGRVGTEALVLACNVAVTDFVPQLRGMILPVRGQLMATEPLPRMFRMGLAVDWGTVYWRQARDGTIVVGGCRGQDADAETSPRELVNSRIQEALDRFLPDAFPGFPAFRVSRRWAGIMDCPVDGKPVVGALPHAPGQYVIAGFAGHGLPGGLGAGKALAQMIAGRQDGAVLAAYDPGRFAMSKLREAGHPTDRHHRITTIRGDSGCATS
jgi:glycine/D-amino acid oxidase-like deaminating enzyme